MNAEKLHEATRELLYREAIEWIAINDEPGGSAEFADIKSYISVVLVADVFGKRASQVARQVLALRAEALAELEAE